MPISGEAQGLAEDEPQHEAAVGPQGYADPDLTRPLADGECDTTP